MQWIGKVSDFIGLLSAVFSLFAWIQARKISAKLEAEKKRQSKLITIRLRYGNEQLELPVNLRRAEFTRAEILGRIGMIPMRDKEQKRFSIRYLNEPEFFRRINEIVDGYGDSVLEIPCSEREIKQFDTSEKSSWFKFGR